MIAYKLFNKRKDGSYGPLFINRKQRLYTGVVYQAEQHLTPGYTFRPGWHACVEPKAPHLSEKNRVWCMVMIDKVAEHMRPERQGGLWYTAEKLQIIGEHRK